MIADTNGTYLSLSFPRKRGPPEGGVLQDSRFRGHDEVIAGMTQSLVFRA